MKRSDFFIRLTTGVLFLAVAAYVVVSLYNRFINVFETAEAFNYTIEETLPSRGYIVRTETVLTETGVTIHPVVNEGERVASGQVVAVEFFNQEAVAIADEMRTLRHKIAQAGIQGGVGDADGLIAVVNLSRAVNSRDFSRLDELSMSVEVNIFMMETDTTMLQYRLDALEAGTIDARDITTPVSGTFSHVVDGFESISPNMIHHLLPTELVSVFENPSEYSGAGKLVTNFKWYYAAVMNNSDVALLSVGERRTVRFYGTFNADVEMVIESMSRREDDYSVVVFSSDRGIHDVAALRSMRAYVLEDTVSGIRVPREALHLDEDGTTFVFLQTAGFAERVNVEILEETGDSYLVRDGLETGSPLRVGSVIIVRANNLYDGRVVG